MSATRKFITNFRRIRAEEWAEWRDLRLRALMDSPDSFSSTYEREVAYSVDEWRRRTAALALGDDRALLVAEADGRLIGSAVVLRQMDGPAQVAAMWVAPERRGVGIGQKLLAAVADFARLKGEPVLRLQIVSGNDAAYALYQHAGFVETGAMIPLARNPALTEIEMELVLA